MRKEIMFHAETVGYTKAEIIERINDVTEMDYEVSDLTDRMAQDFVNRIQQYERLDEDTDNYIRSFARNQIDL